MPLCYTCQSFGIWGSETPAPCGLLDAQKPGPSYIHRGTSRDNLLTHLDRSEFYSKTCSLKMTPILTRQIFQKTHPTWVFCDDEPARVCQLSNLY